MDFLDPKKKRAHRRRLAVGYGLMASLITIATLVLVFTSYGYDIDRRTGTIIQNGLMLLDAKPETAEILINNEKKGTTSNRLVLPEGNYEVELKREGYRSWKKSVILEGSSIEQLVYPVLFPAKLVSKSIQSYDSMPSLATASPDRRWLIVQNPESATTFQSVDLSNARHPGISITLPPAVVTDTDSADSYEAIEWAADNNHVLLKHTYGDKTEFIVLNRASPAESLNLTKLFANQPFTGMQLRDKKFDQYYLHHAPDGKLYTADARSGAPVLIVNSVISFKSYKADVLLYVANPSNNPTMVEVHVRQGGKDSLLRHLPVAQHYLVDVAGFEGHLYLASGSSADGRTYVYKDPFNDLNRHPARTPQPFRVLIVPGAQYVSFSGNARFIAAQGGSTFAVYDAETGRQPRYDIKLPLGPGQKATWMDGHRLAVVSGGNVHVFDFDGTNVQTLNAALAGFPPFFDRDYTALFTLASDPNASAKTVLTRTELKVLPSSQ